MIILGIDPGTATTGWGIVSATRLHRSAKNDLRTTNSKLLTLVDYGCIVTQKDKGMPQRLLRLRKELKRLLGQRKPNVVCVEEHFFGKNRKTAMTVSQARGVILEVCATSGAPIFEYQGFKIKYALTGDRLAKKKIVEKAVKRLLRKRKLAKPKDGFLDDAVDGLAVAIYHLVKS